MSVLDTNVVLELRKAKVGKADRNVAAWASSAPADELSVSAINILESGTDVPLVHRRDPEQGALLSARLDQHVLPASSGRVLPVDTVVAQRCAALRVLDPRSERDALIAATAMVHHMTAVTRNVADFAATGAPMLNPWDRVARPGGCGAR